MQGAGQTDPPKVAGYFMMTSLLAFNPAAIAAA
jgi:hypothetical protein